MISAWKKLLSVFEFISDAFYLTVAFIIGVLLGVVILGASPALSGLYWAASRRADESLYRSVWSAFWLRYRQSFLEANKIILPKLCLLVVLLFEIVVVHQNASGFLRLLVETALFLAIALVALILICLLSSQTAAGFDRWRRTVELLVRQPIHNLMYLTATLLLLRLSTSLQGFGLLLGWGLWAMLIAEAKHFLDKRTPK